MSAKTCLITGANGLLGQKLVKLMPERGWNTVATGRGASRIPEEWPFSYKDIDITDHAAVNDLVDAVRPDVMIHGGAMTQVDDCEIRKDECRAINTLATKNIVKACEKTGTHLIFLSTDFVFDGTDGPYDETATPSPLSYYARSKYNAEQYVMHAAVPWTIIRTVLVFGVVEGGSRSNIVLWVKSSLESGKEINVVNDQYRSPTLAEDLALGCALAAEKKATGIYHISGAETMDMFTLAYRVAKYFKLPEEKIHPVDSRTLNQRAHRPPVTGFIIDKARSALGYEPHSFEEALKIVECQLGI